jgi:GNAT superfamily N-acetyltransferase
MVIDVIRVPLAEILPLRDLYRQAMNCQIVHDSYHQRGYTDSFLLTIDGRLAGYGSVAGLPGHPKDVAKEFYLLPDYRAAALHLFRALLSASGAKSIEAQTNDVLLTLMLLDCAEAIERDKVLFSDTFTTTTTIAGAVFRKGTSGDRSLMFSHTMEPEGEFVIEAGGQIVATGGLMLHYNVPFADIYMEVAPGHRRQGYGAYLVQELKRECYEMGRIPAARCRPENDASRSTLQRAGMLPCARILVGTVHT